MYEWRAEAVASPVRTCPPWGSSAMSGQGSLARFANAPPRLALRRTARQLAARLPRAGRLAGWLAGWTDGLAAPRTERFGGDDENWSELLYDEATHGAYVRTTYALPLRARRGRRMVALNRHTTIRSPLARPSVHAHSM